MEPDQDEIIKTISQQVAASGKYNPDAKELEKELKKIVEKLSNGRNKEIEEKNRKIDRLEQELNLGDENKCNNQNFDKENLINNYENRLEEKNREVEDILLKATQKIDELLHNFEK